MNPLACRVALRPRDPLEVLDLSWRLLRSWRGPLARLSLALLLPAWVVWWGLVLASPEPWAAAVGGALVAPLLQVPFTLLGARLLFGETPGPRVVLSDTTARGGRAAVAWLIGLLTLLVGGCSAMLLWLPVRVLTTFSPETLLLEGTSVGRALRRARTLSMEALGKASVGALVSACCVLWCTVVSEAGGQAVVSGILQLGAPVGQLSAGDVTPFLLLGILSAQPLLALYRLMLYVDVRTTLEGWDLQVALRAEGAAA